MKKNWPFVLMLFLSVSAFAERIEWRCMRDNPKAFFEIFGLELVPEADGLYQLELSRGNYDLHEGRENVKKTIIANKLTCAVHPGNRSILFCEKDFSTSRSDGDNINTYFDTELVVSEGVDSGGKPVTRKALRVHVTSPFTYDPKNSGTNIDPQLGLLKFFDIAECVN